MKEQIQGVENTAGQDQVSIQQWILDRMAATIKVRQDEIDIDLPFSYYGLDSLAATGLSGELEIFLGRKLSPTLTWDYPTISLLASYLAEG